MVVILDTADGQAYNFKTRKQAGEFIGVSLPTLRGMLGEPFFLYHSLIITNTTNEKVQKSNRALLKKTIRRMGQAEIDRVNLANVQGSFPDNRVVPIKGSRPKKNTANVDKTKKNLD